MSGPSSDEELKRQIREELGRTPVPAPSAAKTQAERDEEMNKQIQAELRPPPQTHPAPKSQAERDEETKRQIQAELKQPPQQKPPPSPADKDTELKSQIQAELKRSPETALSQSQTERDAAIKPQIREQMSSGSAVISAPQVPEEDNNASEPTNRRSRTDGTRRTRRNQEEADDAMKAEIRNSRNNGRGAVGHSRMNLEPGAVGHSRMNLEPGASSTAVVGDNVNPITMTSVERAERQPSVVQEETTSEINLASPPGSSKSIGMDKERPEPLPEGQQVGAVAVATRAYGGLPAWIRQNAQNNRGAVSNRASDLPPEMRTTTDQSNLPPEMRTTIDQSNLPPEMRAVVDDQSNVPPEMRISIDGSPGADPSVPSAEVTPANKTATDAENGKGIWFWLCVLVSVVAAAVVSIAVGVTSGGGNSNVVTKAPTASPTQSPTLFTVPDCGFESIDPNLENMDAETRERYNDLVVTLVPSLVPGYSEPIKAADYCSAAHLAVVWLANDDMDSKYPQNVLENRFLLAFLYVDWEGYSWKNTTGWLTDSSECDWYGISCGVDRSMDELDLIGAMEEIQEPLTIPSEIGQFPDLRSLKLRNNGLEGSVPSTLRNLSNLEILDLSENSQLSGAFPFSSLPLSMRSLFLKKNGGLQLTFPLDIDQWSNLEFLSVSCRVEGGIPAAMGKLTNLAVLNLFRSSVEGQIPVEIGGMINLQFLDLGQNKLDGSLPTEISLLGNLKWLYLTRNEYMSGTIPSEIGNLSLLERLVIDKQPLTGTIPTEIGRCTSLETLILSETDIEGSLPSELTSLSDLTTLDLSKSLFDGLIHSSLLSLTKLVAVNFAGTDLTGDITVNTDDFSLLDCFTIQNAAPELSVTLQSETCSKTFDSSLDATNKCKYVRLEDCECCPGPAKCGEGKRRIQLTGCAYEANDEGAMTGDFFDEYLQL